MAQVMSSSTSGTVDLTKVREFLARLIADRGQEFRFTEQNVEANPRLHDAAVAYLQVYQGTFDFLISVQRYFAEYGEISNAQAKGVLNCLLAEVRRQKSPTWVSTFVPTQTHAQAQAQPTNPRGSVEQVIGNGFYTIVLNPDDVSDYLTLRVKDTDYGDLPEGAQVVGYLFGPVNTTDYQNCAFLIGSRVIPFKKYRSVEYTRLLHALDVLSASNGSELDMMGRAYAMHSGTCYRCNRLLTTPESIARGLGPICAGIIEG